MAKINLSPFLPKKRARESIAKAIRLGHNEAITNLDDLILNIGIPETEVENLLRSVISELIGAGYNARYDDIAALYIRF